MARIQARGPDGRKGIRLEELLELHRGTHVAFDLELAGHVRARRVLLAADDLLERGFGGRDDGVCVVPALADAHLAVVDPDRPLACALDVEEVRVGHAGRLRSVGAALQTVEELPDGHGSNPISVTGSSFCCTRRGGSLAARAIAATGAAAATRSAVRRLVASATRPSTTAATPPGPTERPMTSPDAIPM